MDHTVLELEAEEKKNPKLLHYDSIFLCYFGGIFRLLLGYFGVTLRLTLGVTLGVALGVALGVTLGFTLGVIFGVTFGLFC